MNENAYECVQCKVFVDCDKYSLEEHLNKWLLETPEEYSVNIVNVTQTIDKGSITLIIFYEYLGLA